MSEYFNFPPLIESGEGKDIISLEQAAFRVGVHVRTLQRLAAKGEFTPAFKIGNQWRVSVPKLEMFLHG